MRFILLRGRQIFRSELVFWSPHHFLRASLGLFLVDFMVSGWRVSEPLVYSFQTSLSLILVEGDRMPAVYRRALWLILVNHRRSEFFLDSLLFFLLAFALSITDPILKRLLVHLISVPRSYRLFDGSLSAISLLREHRALSEIILSELLLECLRHLRIVNILVLLYLLLGKSWIIVIWVIICLVVLTKALLALVYRRILVYRVLVGSNALVRVKFYEGSSSEPLLLLNWHRIQSQTPSSLENDVVEIVLFFIELLWIDELFHVYVFVLRSFSGEYSLNISLLIMFLIFVLLLVEPRILWSWRLIQLYDKLGTFYAPLQRVGPICARV